MNKINLLIAQAVVYKITEILNNDGHFALDEYRYFLENEKMIPGGFALSAVLQEFIDKRVSLVHIFDDSNDIESLYKQMLIKMEQYWSGKTIDVTDLFESASKEQLEVMIQLLNDTYDVFYNTSESKRISDSFASAAFSVEELEYLAKLTENK